MKDQKPDLAASARAGNLRRNLVRLAPLAIMLLVFAVVILSGVWRHLSLEELRSRRTDLKAFVHSHPVESVLLYMGLYCAVVALSLPGALIMSMSGGFLFGVFAGGSAAVAGVSSGAILMFLVARTAIGDVIRKRTAPDGMFRKIQDGVRRHAFSYLLFLRLMPAAPIWMVNFAAGLVRTPFSTYALATVVGIAPSTFIYASIGAGLDAAFVAPGPLSLRSFFHWQTFAPLFGLAILSTTPLLFVYWRGRR